MRWRDPVRRRLALSHLRRWVWSERRRNALSVLGLVVGVAVSMVALSTLAGEGARFRRELRLIGARTLSVLPERGRLPSLSTAGLAGSFPEARRFSRLVWSESELRGRDGERLPGSVVLGVDTSFFELLSEAPVRGRRLAPVEIARSSWVGVLGAGSARKLRHPEVVFWNGVAVPIVGILEAPVREGIVRTSVPAVLGESLLVPAGLLETLPARHRLRDAWILEASEERLLEPLRGRIRSWLEPRLDKPLHVATAAEALREERATRGFLTWALAALGSVSLLLGGVGLLNNMLSLVLERRAEIGLRRALGASPGDIGLQFLAESAVIAGLGCAAGEAVGLAALGLAPTLGIAVSVNYWVVGAPAGLGIGLGLLFGAIPAARAARCVPIEALRGGG